METILKRLLHPSFILMLFVLVFLGGCATMQSHWQAAKSADTIEAYEEFLKQYPEGDLSNQTRKRLDSLYEKSDWKDSNQKNTIADFEEFLKKYPLGRFTDEVHSQLEPLYFQKAGEKNTIVAFEEFLENYPQSKYANEALSKLENLREKEKQHIISEWLRTTQADTIDEYLLFLRNFSGKEFTQDALQKLFLKSVNDPKFEIASFITFELDQGSSQTLIHWVLEGSSMVIYGTPPYTIYIVRDPSDPVVFNQEAKGLTYKEGKGVVIRVKEKKITNIWGFK